METVSSHQLISIMQAWYQMNDFLYIVQWVTHYKILFKTIQLVSTLKIYNVFSKIPNMAIILKYFQPNKFIFHFSMMKRQGQVTFKLQTGSFVIGQ